MKPQGQDNLYEALPARVDALLSKALERGASDLHLNPGGREARIFLRVDGQLEEAGTLSLQEAAGFCNRFKVLAGLAVHRSDIPQDGAFHFLDPSSGATADLRLSLLPLIHGEKAVLRILEKQGPGLETLGFGRPEVEALESALKAPDGLIVVCGPSGSGKSTTIYALLRALAESKKGRLHAVSLEDPVEKIVEEISQAQVNLERGLDYPALLKAVMRQDPEVIAISETRDPETAKAALRASFTGHLVITSLHCGRAWEAPRRLADLGLPQSMLASSLRLVLAQRLALRPCLSCAGKGCGACASRGYKGRIAYGEAMPVTEASMRALLAASVDPAQVRDFALERGMRPMEESEKDLVANGLARPRAPGPQGAALD